MSPLPVAALTSLLAAPVQAPPPQGPERARGVVTREEGMSPGYTLISPFSTTSAFLLDADGQVVHEWKTEYRPGLFPYLLDDGRLLRGLQVNEPVIFRGGGQSGGVQLLGWDGSVDWEYHLATQRALHHHDIEPMPNGNVLMIAWDYHSKEEAIARGRNPERIDDRGFWPDMIVEIEPQPPFGARIVWEWHAFDHLVQDRDLDLPNYGDIEENPHRIDINADEPQELSAAERQRLIALGYLQDDGNGGGDDDDDRYNPDWMHTNAVAYNEELDQIALSVLMFNEVWVIDHSTTTEEARGSKGGRSGRGGDLLYRWGNPQRYRRGDATHQQLFGQHNVEWVPADYPGAGNLTIFNNGRGRPNDDYSSVVEIETPIQENGTYALDDDAPFGPEAPDWEYAAEDKTSLFASFISGAHRCANGNTLVCSGPDGRVLEVTADGDTVWEFLNPFGVPQSHADGGFGLGMFRARRIPPDHPGLAGRELTPLDPQPETFEELRLALPEHPAEFDAERGWQPLFDPPMSRWANVNCAEGETFTFQFDPDSGPYLRCTGKPTGLLRTKKMYENFIVDFSWRHMEDGGNAGFFVWADPLPATGGPFTRGIEVQVCNLGNGSWFTSHGDIFPIWGARMTPDPSYRISGSRSMPKEDAFHANPTGEWNHYRITCLDGAITLEVNGRQVTAGADCSPRKGYLCLESEGGEVHFRDLRILELPSGTRAASAEDTAEDANELRTLYNGLALGESWEVLAGQWTAADWRLQSDGGVSTAAASAGEATSAEGAVDPAAESAAAADDQTTPSTGAAEEAPTKLVTSAANGESDESEGGAPPSSIGAEIRIPLPEGTTEFFFDYRRGEVRSGMPPPIRLGKRELMTLLEKPDTWTRVHVRWSEDLCTVELEGATYRFPLADFEGTEAIVLIDHGIPTQFCSLFAGPGETAAGE